MRPAEEHPNGQAIRLAGGVAARQLKRFDPEHNRAVFELALFDTNRAVADAAAKLTAGNWRDGQPVPRHLIPRPDRAGQVQKLWLNCTSSWDLPPKPARKVPCASNRLKECPPPA